MERMNSKTMITSRFYYLWTSALLILVWSASLAWLAWTQSAMLGVVSWRLVPAPVIGFLAACLTPIAVYRLRTWPGPKDGVPFTRIPTYYRLVVILKAAAFLLAVMGGHRHGYERLSVYILCVVLLHRLMLCFPAGLQAVVRACAVNRVLRAMDIIVTSVLVTLFLGELIIHTIMVTQDKMSWQLVRSSPLGNKLKKDLFGLPPNDLGYNDEAFDQERRPDSLRIAMVGDSFVVSYVPRPYGLVASTERFLRESLDKDGELDVYNFGIVASSPSEYVEILRRDALRFDPDIVVVGFYIGNDVKEGYPIISPLNKHWYSLYKSTRDWLDSRRKKNAVNEDDVVDLTQITNTDRDYWFDPGAVPPAFSREKYLNIVRRHLRVCQKEREAHKEEGWVAALTALLSFKRICEDAEKPMLLAIFPEHIQVSPALFDEVTERFELDPADYDLTMPQQRLKKFCNEQEIACLDLTEVLQRAGGDPDHLYLNNDSHWSALGNEVAGKALAGKLEEWIHQYGLLNP